MTHKDYAPYDHVAVAVFGIEVGPDGVPHYGYLNPAASAVTGLRLGEIERRTALEVHEGRAGEVAYQRHLKAIASGDAVTYLLDISVAGRTRLLRTTLTPLHDASGKVSRLIGTTLEVGQGQTSGPLRSKAQSEVEHFIAMAAHDLRTPMRNVQIIAEMLREDIPGHSQSARELINLLDDVARKSSELIGDVLDHALAGATIPDALPFDFDVLCRVTTGVLDPQGRHTVHWPKAAVRGDKTAVQIVLRNLLDNAFKHGGSDHLRVNISLRALPGELVEFTVADNGIGFDTPGKAFLDSSAFGVSSGYGLLGVRRLITARGGTIQVYKGQGGTGCIARFTLPGSVAVRRDARPEYTRRYAALGLYRRHWHVVPSDPPADQRRGRAIKPCVSLGNSGQTWRQKAAWCVRRSYGLRRKSHARLRRPGQS